MRNLRFLNLAILSGLLASTMLVYAQDDKQEDHPARQEDAKPQPKQDEAKPARPEEGAPLKQEAKPDNKPAQNQSHEQAMPNREDRPGQPAEHARVGQDNAHPAGRGGHIPDEQFRTHFGQGHHFRAQGVIVAGQPQFQYSGYTFQFVDAWPVGWAYTDDCYVDYIDGEYFLFDVLHPGVRIALLVIM
jgi:hypothetical protein